MAKCRDLIDILADRSLIGVLYNGQDDEQIVHHPEIRSIKNEDEMFQFSISRRVGSYSTPKDNW